MFGFKSTKEQLLEERRKNAQLQAALEKTSADVEYIAMMTDVELEEDEPMETEVENDDAQ
ncbi:MAG: hypothetical protein IJK01_06875 [Clostridia bacterium]|nr:hypothetical protein [Clostridia bacterium]